ncbi:hypothetical protein [Deinococcus alpinitundrae]|uniref:hypothetical protein n=1 Tax=Deinococcus alpinitundrae TaxID=468913 RepID=UPI0013797D79|nr:hypothetical protein [Deinococcus alpinitundrae]
MTATKPPERTVVSDALHREIALYAAESLRMETTPVAPLMPGCAKLTFTASRQTTNTDRSREE